MDLEKKGGELEKQGNFREAIKIYDEIIVTQPANGYITNQLGVCYFNLGEYSSAIATFKKVLRIKNDIPDVYNNMGTCYVKTRQYKEAETALQISLRMQDADQTHYALGNLYFYMKEYEKSVFHYKQISNLNTNPRFLYNLGFSYLGQKRFLKGFSLYENRLKDISIVPQTNEIPRVEIPWIPTWDGKTDYAHLLVIYEQGIGDNIQYFRFIIELSRKFPERKITYFCKNTVAHLFKSYPNIHVVMNLSVNMFDFKAYIMSLPFYLKIKTIEPISENYIITNPQKDKYWTEYFATHYPKKHLKIGFVTNGLLSSFIEKNIPLIEWNIFSDLENTTFICLEKGVSKEQQKKCSEHILFLDIDTDRSFEDSMSILPHLDIFITVDTAIAHLAGIMNVKTWLLLGYGSDWRWFSNSDINSVWYSSSLELLRMQENKDMKELLPVVKSRIRDMKVD
jgi:tetratricopeptide (TPR) repeat protein